VDTAGRHRGRGGSRPDGPGQRAKLVTALGGFAAVIGESVELADLPASLPAAQLALALRERGVLTEEPVHVEERLAALIVHQRPRLLRSLRGRLLAPLDAQPAAARERLEQTLRSWLTQLGNRQAMARELHVHPQTVRYRLAQLRELYGADLDDPRTRAALIVALAWSGPGQTSNPAIVRPDTDLHLGLGQPRTLQGSAGRSMIRAPMHPSHS
jgi:DNA-binding PucR family transcriptional regulator